MVSVNKYIKNVGKSVLYTTADVMKEKFDYITDFKSTNSDLMKDTYNAIKDYKTTFTRMKKSVTESDLYNAGGMAIKNLLQDIKTGDFYNKQREEEYTNKFGVDLMFDMDDNDFSWDDDSFDMTDGDKVIATSINKNSKISTSILSETITLGNKAVIESNKDNTSLLYIQNERLLSKLDHRLNNIGDTMFKYMDASAKSQKSQMDNTNRFFSNIDNNVNKIEKTLKEILDIQKAMTSKAEKKVVNKGNTITDITSGGVPDLKAYGNIIKQNVISELNKASGGMFDSLMGKDGTGANMAAIFAANPAREILSGSIKKSMPKHFDRAAKDFNETLKGYFTTLVSRFNQDTDSDDPLRQALGKIFKVRVDKSRAPELNKYQKGPVPFDGKVRKSIIEVLPYYLRKMTSYITGEDERAFNFETGKWENIKHVQKELEDTEKSSVKSGMNNLTSMITKSIGGNMKRAFKNFNTQEDFNKAYERLMTVLYNNNGDLRILNDPMMYGLDEGLVNLIKKAAVDTQYDYVNKTTTGAKGRGKTRVKGINFNNKYDGLNSGINNRKSVVNIAGDVFDANRSLAEHYRRIANDDTAIERLLFSEGIGLDYNRSGFKDKYGDIRTDPRKMQSPMTKALLYLKDTYNNTIFDYLKSIRDDVRGVRSNTNVLGGGPSDGTNSPTGSNDSYDSYSDGINKNDIRYNRAEYVRNKDRNRIAYERAQYDNSKKNEKNRHYLYADDVEGLGSYINANTHNRFMNLRERMDNEEVKNIYTALESFGILKPESSKELQAIKYDKTKKFMDQLKENSGAMKKLALLGDISTTIMEKPWQAATNAIVSMDKWIYSLFFENNFKIKNKDGKEEEEEGLFGIIKNKFVHGFEDLTKVISDKFSYFMENIFGKLTNKLSPVMKLIFGDKDDNGRRSGGVFGDFVGGVQDAWGREVENMKQLAKETAKSVMPKKQEPETQTVSEEIINSSGMGSTENLPPDSLERNGTFLLLYEDFKRNKIFFSDLDIEDPTYTEKRNRKYYKKYIDWCIKNNIPYRTARYITTVTKFKIEYSRKYAPPEMLGPALPKEIDTLRGGFSNISVAGFLKAKKMRYFKDEDDIQSYISWCDLADIPMTDRIHNDIIERYTKERDVKEKRSKHKDRYEQISALAGNNIAEKLKASRNISGTQGNNPPTPTPSTRGNLLEELEKGVDRIVKAIDNFHKNFNNFTDSISKMFHTGGQSSDPNQLSFFAKGGINASGMPIKSVVSSGEIINGTVVPPGGPYVTTIPRNAVVINPNNDSTVRKQYSQEKSFLNGLRSNASADDGLTPINTNGISKYINTKNSKTAADALVRGGIGGGLGLLLGHPILAAAIGVSSSFANKATGFSEFLFGEATQVDEDGKVISRMDNGMLSQEIQKALPDVKKLGILGGVAGLITPVGAVGGLLIGSALGFAKNNDLVKDTLFGDLGVFNKDRIDKVKKALPAMGIGAAAAGLIGVTPFGLVPNLILGSLGGFAATTDKFKEIMMGDYGEDGKRHGGVIGVMKRGIEPFKDFGATMIDETMNAVFGKKVKVNGKEERVGGIFGLVKDQIVKPVTESVAPLLKEITYMVDRITKSVSSGISKFLNNRIGGRIGDKMMSGVTSLGKGAINVAKAGLWVGATPLMAGAQAIKGLGMNARRKQLREGRADDLTAEERIRFRKHSMFMSNGQLLGDDYSDVDQAILDLRSSSGVSKLKDLRSNLGFAVSGKEGIEEEDVKLRKNFNAAISDYVKGISGGALGYKRGAADIMKAINNNDYKQAENLILGHLNGKDGKNISDVQRTKLMEMLDSLKGERNELKDRYNNISKAGSMGTEDFKRFGLNIDLNNKDSVTKIQKYLDREIINMEAGMSEADKRKAMENDPNNPINKNTSELSRLNMSIEDLIMAITDKDKFLAEVERRKSAGRVDADDTSHVRGGKFVNPAIDVINSARQDRAMSDEEKTLTKEATDIWENNVKSANADKDGYISFNIDGVDYRFNIYKDADITQKDEYNRFVQNYVQRSGIPTKSKHRLMKTLWGKFRKISPTTLALTMALGPGALAAKVGFDVAKVALPKAGKFLGNKARTLKHSLVDKAADLKEKVNEKSSNATSGIRNRIAGAKDNINKGEATKTDKLIAALEDLPGKLKVALLGDGKDNPGGIKNVLKTVFGISKYAIGVPLMVGFLNQTVLPFIKDKMGPALFGTKNDKGEYTGGLVSGIVNPIRKALDNSFGMVKKWFGSEAPFEGPNKGLEGMMNGFKSIIDSLVDTWMNGFEVITSKWITRGVEMLISNAPTLIGALGEGIILGLKGLFKSDDDTKTTSKTNLTSLAGGGGGTTASIDSRNVASTKIYNTVSGATVTLKNNSTAVSPNETIQAINSLNSTTARLTSASRSGLPSKSSSPIATPAKPISSSAKGVYISETTPSGDSVYYDVTDTKKLNPLRKGEDEQYYKASDLMQQSNPDLINNSAYQEGLADDYVNEHEYKAKNEFAGKTIKTATRHGFKMLATGKGYGAVKATGRLIGGIGKVASILGPGGKIASKGLKGISKVMVGKTAKKGATEADTSTKGAKLLEWVLTKVTKLGPFKKLLKEGGAEAIKDGILKTAIKKASKELAEKAAKKGAAALSKLILRVGGAIASAGVIEVVFIAADFTAGAVQARDILKIVNKEVTPFERIISGLTKVITGYLFILPDAFVANILLETIGVALFKQQTEEIREKQAEALEALEAYNTEHGTDWSLEEYNHQKNTTIFNKAEDKFKEIFNKNNKKAEKALSGESGSSSSGKSTGGAGNIRGNAFANDGLIPLSLADKSFNNTTDIMNGTSSFENLEKESIMKNSATNDLINKGKLSPSDKKFWQISEVNSGNVYLDSMINMRETFNRLIKAPFSLIAKSMGDITVLLGSSSSTSSSSNTNNTNNEAGASKASSSSSNLVSKIKSAFSLAFGVASVAFGKGKGKSKSGKGDDNHVYQRDYNDPFNTFGDSERQTVADSGCGPAAAANILNKFSPKNKMKEAVNYALEGGYKEPDGGTYPQFFNDYLGQYGIPTAQVDNNGTINSLMNNKPVVLMGQDTQGSGRTPYGKDYSHYVVATGLDNRGNVIIEDSEDPNARRTYGLRDVLKNSSVKIATGAGYGRGAMSVLSNYTSSVMRGVYGPYLNALYGETDDSNNTITSQSNSGSIPSISNNTVTVNPTSDVEKNKMMIWKFFRAKGYSKEATAGIIGNMMKEDGTLTGSNKSRSWNNSSSFTDGIIQWDPFTKHINWAKQNGYDPYDLTGQLMHVVHMIENEWATWRKEYVGVNGYKYIPGPELKYCTNIANATVAFERGVEGSGDWSSDRDASRIKYAMSVYQTYANSGMGRARSLIKSVSNKMHIKYGKASTHIDKSITNKYVPKFGRADEPMTTTPTTDTGSKSILYQVGDYAGKLMKGVYGKYFDALYGTEQADNSSGSDSSGSTIPADFNPNGEIFSPINGPFYVSSMYSPTGSVGTRGMHGGIDLVSLTDTKGSAVDTKAQIYSLCAGVVVHAGWENPSDHSKGFGLYVAIKDKVGDVWYYGHLSSVNVSVGDTVNIGTIVGVIGATGNQSGLHLHFEVRKQGIRGNTMDPATIIGIPSNLDYISAGGILNALFVGNVFNPRTYGGGGRHRYSTPERESASDLLKLQMQQASGFGRGRSARKRTSPSQAIQSRISNMQKSKTIKRNAVNNSSKIFTDHEINTAVHDFQKDSNNNKLFSEYKNIDMRSTSGHGTNNSKDNGTTIVNNNTNVELDKVVNLLEALVESNKKNDIIINLLAAIVTNTESGGSGTTNQKFKSALSQIQSSAPSDILSQVYSLAGM